MFCELNWEEIQMAMSEQEKKENLLERYDEQIAPHLPKSNRYKEKLKNYSYTSLKNPIQGLTKFVEFIEEFDIDVSEVEEADFALWHSYLNNRVADTTAKNYFYAGIKYLRFTGLLDREAYEDSAEESYANFRNIQTEKQKYAQDNKIDLWFSREQFEQMLSACDLFRDRILIQFLYHTGARATECSNTRLDDVDLVERSIEITTAKRQDSHTRTIYYPNEMVEDMRNWVQEARHNYSYADTSKYLLLGRDKKQIDEQFIRNKVVNLAKEAGFQEVLYTDSQDNKQHLYTPHEFRRGYIVRHLEAEMPTPYLKEVVGHKQLETTEKYISQADSVLKQAQKEYRPE
jgi:integrase